jgi:hypothetical protein
VEQLDRDLLGVQLLKLAHYKAPQVVAAPEG